MIRRPPRSTRIDTLSLHDALPISLRNQPIHAIGDVVLHAQSPLAETSFPQFAAVACSPTIIHLQHAVAPVSQKLGFMIKAPSVTRQRSSVLIDTPRPALGRSAQRQGESARYIPTAAPFVKSGTATLR